MKTEALYKKLSDPKFLKVCLGIALAWMFVTIFQREVKGDDCWFGEQSYWLAHEGVVKLKSLPSIFSWDQKMLAYHKLLIWIGGGIVWLFGWSVEYFRIFNLLCFGTSIWLIWKFLSKEPVWLKLLVAFLFIFNPMSFGKSYEFRPEVVVMMFGMGSFYCLWKYLEQEVLWYVALAGLLAGLAFLTHLNSAMYCVSGFIVLLYYRKYRELVLFSFVGGVICFIYFIPLLQPENFTQWRYVILNWPLHSFDEAVEKNVFLNILGRLVSEQKRFFWGEQTIGTACLFIVAFIAKGKYLWHQHRFLTLYTICQVLLLALIGSHKAPRYLMLNFPFMFLVVGFAMQDLMKTHGRKLLKATFLVLLLLQCVFLVIRSAKVLPKNGPHLEKHEQMASFIPKGEVVLAPWPFIYNQIADYEVHNYDNYLYLEEQRGTTFTQEDIFREAQALGTKFVIIDNYATNKYPWFDDLNLEEPGVYKEIERNDEFVVLKLNAN